MNEKSLLLGCFTVQTKVFSQDLLHNGYWLFVFVYVTVYIEIQLSLKLH